MMRRRRGEARRRGYAALAPRRGAALRGSVFPVVPLRFTTGKFLACLRHDGDARPGTRQGPNENVQTPAAGWKPAPHPWRGRRRLNTYTRVRVRKTPPPGAGGAAATGGWPRPDRSAGGWSARGGVVAISRDFTPSPIVARCCFCGRLRRVSLRSVRRRRWRRGREFYGRWRCADRWRGSASCDCLGSLRDGRRDCQ